MLSAQLIYACMLICCVYNKIFAFCKNDTYKLPHRHMQFLVSVWWLYGEASGPCANRAPSHYLQLPKRHGTGVKRAIYCNSCKWLVYSAQTPSASTEWQNEWQCTLWLMSVFIPQNSAVSDHMCMFCIYMCISMWNRVRRKLLMGDLNFLNRKTANLENEWFFLLNSKEKIFMFWGSGRQEKRKYSWINNKRSISMDTAVLSSFMSLAALQFIKSTLHLLPR